MTRAALPSVTVLRKLAFDVVSGDALMINGQLMTVHHVEKLPDRGVKEYYIVIWFDENYGNTINFFRPDYVEVAA